jgi:hypothetical protein
MYTRINLRKNIFYQIWFTRWLLFVTTDRNIFFYLIQPRSKSFPLRRSMNTAHISDVFISFFFFFFKIRGFRYREFDFFFFISAMLNGAFYQTSNTFSYTHLYLMEIFNLKIKKISQ